ncbi:MAG: hypothetical protein M3O32_08400, partial [Actinomycetota bacterium]|nr:hypothetical protein [Actinomycetota bacterium]
MGRELVCGGVGLVADVGQGAVMGVQLLDVVPMCRRDGLVKRVGFGEVAEHSGCWGLPGELASRGQCHPSRVTAPVGTGMQVRRIDFHDALRHNVSPSANQNELAEPEPVNSQGNSWHTFA